MSDQEQQAIVSSENTETRRVTMPQDIRYSTEQNDREKLMEKYNNYQISDTNASNIRFLTDNRQKKNLFGRNEGKIIRSIFILFSCFLEENANLHSLAKTFNVNMFVSILFSSLFILNRYVFFCQPGYQHATKHSYKIFGTEADVRKCLIEIMNRMFKLTKIDKSQETEISTSKFYDY
jgi:hypothetical protein